MSETLYLLLCIEIKHPIASKFKLGASFAVNVPDLDDQAEIFVVA